jgi:DNA primase
MDRTEVEKLKADIDIISVISEYVHLKKRGRSYIGLCPFHKEKTPSFNVDPVKQIYKCFGCDKGGDVINFVMEIKGLSFLEAIQELASRFNIPVDLGKTNKSSETKQFYEINRYAMEFYKHMLSGSQGRKAREYLHKRGLSDETIQAFHIGYAPPSWDSLLKVLKKKGIPYAKASVCGLIIERENGGYYDRFRDRVMFPILDISSEVIGFGGRIMDSSEPKYINTPEGSLQSVQGQKPSSRVRGEGGRGIYGCGLPGQCRHSKCSCNPGYGPERRPCKPSEQVYAGHHAGI